MKLTNLVLTILLGLSLMTGSCILVVDDTGMSAHSAWYDWEDDDAPVLRGSGVAASETREVGDFHAVEVRGSTDVTITVGAAKSVVVHADDNLVQHVVTRVEDGLLILELERGNYRFKCDLSVEIGAPALDGLQICGSGDAEIEGLDEAALRIAIAGSGNVEASGKVEALSASIAGSGDIDAFEVKAGTASVSIAGSGDVDVDVSETLSADISGSGDVRYRGTPQVTRSIAGSGSVERD